jgi:peptidoglycan/xylan/chitin deacetylase (PgdA/CDA1 family)
MSKKVSIITIIVVALVIAGWYFNVASLYYIIPISILYLIINIFGSANIKLNYFFHSHCNAATSKKEIALTFDDGPHPVITPLLLELLNKHNITATFFCTGKNAENNPDIVSKITTNGHIIGNHSYGHSKFFDLLSARKMQKEISLTNEVISSITGKTPLLFRPPYGVTNPMLRKAISKSKLISIGWSLRSFDTVKNSQKVLNKLLSNTMPGDIVLFHDTNAQIITIIEDYLLWLQKNDYKIVSLTSLLNIPAYEE